MCKYLTKQTEKFWMEKKRDARSEEKNCVLNGQLLGARKTGFVSRSVSWSKKLNDKLKWSKLTYGSKCCAKRLKAMITSAHLWCSWFYSFKKFNLNWFQIRSGNVQNWSSYVSNILLEVVERNFGTSFLQCYAENGSVKILALHVF